MSEAKNVKTQKRKPVRTLLKSLVNVKKWSSYDEVSSNTQATVGLFRRLLKHGSQDKRKETYEEAIQRLELTPEQEIVRKKNFLYSTFIYLAFDLVFILYLFYLLINDRLLASFVTVILICVMSLATYREHFWYMQMSKKKLGCSFRDWKNFVLRKEA